MTKNQIARFIGLGWFITFTTIAAILAGASWWSFVGGVILASIIMFELMSATRDKRHPTNVKPPRKTR